MKSNKAKSLQRVGGTSMLEKICKTAAAVSKNITLVVGFDKESIIQEANALNLNISSIEQPKPIGTGDAVNCGLEMVKNNSKVLVLYGDVPLIKKETIEKLIHASDEGLSILTTILDNPNGYGRVVKDDQQNVVAIVEEKDANTEERKIKEIFTGVLCASSDILSESISEIDNNNAACEFYLTDIVSIIAEKGYKIKSCIAPNEEVKGANTKEELLELENIYRSMKANELLNMGVTISDLSRIDIRGNVEVGKDCCIDVNVILDGEVKLGNNVSIGPNSIIKDTEIGDNSIIEAFSHIVSSKIGKDCSIGPYARLREGSIVEHNAKIGNFVETKKTKVGEKSKANHFAYLGDTEIGEDTNIGAGTITCNYDGVKKHQTIIGI